MGGHIQEMEAMLTGYLSRCHQWFTWYTGIETVRKWESITLLTQPQSCLCNTI